MSKETSKWVADVDKEVAEAAEAHLGYGDKTELIQRLAEVIANKGLSPRTPYDARIRQLQEERRDKTRERDKLQSEIDEIEDEIEILREKRGQFESPESKLERELSSLDTKLRSYGLNIYPEQIKVQDVSEEYGLTPQQVVNKMKERNPDVPAHAFSDPDGDEYFDDWRGFDDESKATLPPSERGDAASDET